MVWCGRSNERPYLDEVGIFNKSFIIILLHGACGRSNERPYELSVVRVRGDRALMDIEYRAPGRRAGRALHGCSLMDTGINKKWNDSRKDA
ncbi:MAG: hypothetical protein SPH30_04960 [Prevotella sp.]|nr:hypothetical protein [Prevotella sp.]